MRDYRIWNKETKSMVYGIQLGIWQGLCDDAMQDTGMRDKFGKKIYEKDIVMIDGVGKCRVDYLDHSMKYFFQTLNGYNGQFIAQPRMVEVIGNVYDNPELNVS